MSFDKYHEFLPWFRELVKEGEVPKEDFTFVLRTATTQYGVSTTAVQREFGVKKNMFSLWLAGTTCPIPALRLTIAKWLLNRVEKNAFLGT